MEKGELVVSSSRFLSYTQPCGRRDVSGTGSVTHPMLEVSTDILRCHHCGLSVQSPRASSNTIQSTTHASRDIVHVALLSCALPFEKVRHSQLASLNVTNFTKATRAHVGLFQVFRGLVLECAVASI